MPSYLSPGVYVEEVPSGSRPIEGVGTAVAAFVGFAVLTLALTVTDLRAQLIPDRINLPGSAACAVLLGLGAFAAGQQAALGRAALGAVVWAAFALILDAARP